MGAYDVDIPATLESLRTSLVGALGGGRAHWDPAKVNAPGVWINFLNLETPTLEGVWVRVELVLAVRSSDPQAIAGALSSLWNTVTTLYGKPDGPVRTQGTVFPDGPNPRPSLVLPYLARA